ncbi:hypothetical protein N7490_001838 [Penicillium lividum]|nr:hypothetical protein N7490_001838 [Penicillium lividum]
MSENLPFARFVGVCAIVCIRRIKVQKAGKVLLELSGQAYPIERHTWNVCEAGVRANKTLPDAISEYKAAR